MKLYLLANVAPVAGRVERELPLERSTPSPRKQRHSNAFIISELYNLNDKDVWAFTSRDQAIDVVGTTATILYELEISEATPSPDLQRILSAELLASNTIN